MTSTLAYKLLCASLGLLDPAPEIEALLDSKCEQAEAALRRSGLVLLSTSPADCALIAAYAEWLYKRRNAEDPKPRALTDEIRSRQLCRKPGGAL